MSPVAVEKGDEYMKTINPTQETTIKINEMI